jgi:hypothetical protein
MTKEKHLMSKEEIKNGSAYQPEVYLRTGVNLSLFTWLALLGLPALLLFLIYSKMDERMTQPTAAPAAVQMEQAHH